MAKRKSEIEVNHIAGNAYRVWADDGFVDKARKIEGIQEISPRKVDGAWTLWVDPRYDADEVIAEIEALGEPLEVDEWPLREEAQALGRKVGKSGQLIYTVVEVLRGAEESYRGDYEATLLGVVADIIKRLQRGGW